ncbi:MAG: DUF4838 domain-containing protein [Akkermansiaceae bacterium]
MASCDAAENFQLVADGKGLASIVLAEKPTPAAYLAAVEIQHGIKTITGCSLPILSAKDVIETQPMILIGESKFTKQFNIDTSTFSHVEYMVAIDVEKIILIGKDSPTTSGKEIDYGRAVGTENSLKLKLPGMYSAQGSLRAAYHFLEQSCGIRYYGPRPHLCYFPVQTSLSVGPLNIRREPFLKYTNGLCSDHNGHIHWPIQKILYDSPSSDEVLLFARRMRTGGKKWHVNHSYESLMYRQRFGKTPDPQHPNIYQGYRKEFWPPEGSPSHQLCYSSETLAKQVAQDAADYFDGKLEKEPYGVAPGLDIFPVVPYDAGNYCTCARCEKLLFQHRGRKEFGVFGDGTATDYVFNFANMVARHLKKTHPDKYISVLAYEGYLWKPVRIQLESNVLAVPCLVTCSYWNKRQLTRDWAAFNYWKQNAIEQGKPPLYLWNYYHQPEEIGALRGHKVFPHFSPNRTHQLARQYKKANVEGVFLCGWGEGLDFYAMMKGFDDPDLDISDLLDEYFILSFGNKAGAYMRRFYKTIEDISNDSKNYKGYINEQVFWEYQGNQKNLDQLDAMLIAAEKHLPSELARKRFRPWKRLMVYMRQGHAEWAAKKEKLFALPPHTSIAPGYIQPKSIYSGNETRHFRLVTGWQMEESPQGVFGSKNAKLDVSTDADRGWEEHGGPNGISVTFDLGDVYELDEIRIWNFQQNRGWGLHVKGMKNVKIELSHETDELSSWKTLTKATIPIANDRESFPASAVIPAKSQKARYVRITAVGGVGIGNWASPEHHAATYAGLGQVRIYGKKSSR